ncbi:Glutamate--tRNA ligase mitochondrial [Cryptotrichosporon argae]
MRPLATRAARAAHLTHRRHCSTVSLSAGPSSSSSVTAPAPAGRLRFAPSPTGHLHLGGLRTALFNHLLARKLRGSWLLRIEDTDRTRLVPGAIDSLRHTLDWAGLDYDEGIGAGGSHGPYTQSERLDLYRHYAEQLLDAGAAYRCFCTPDEAQAIRVALLKQGRRSGYDGQCRHLSDDEVGRRRRAGHKSVIRFKSGQDDVPLPADLVFGDVKPTTTAEPEDFVILKSDGYPTYHLASVVDDHLMEISHVLRGEEWLPSLPKHHALYRALGWSPPQFAHLPLLCNADGTKLSKRTGDVHVEHYRQSGYEPGALLNFLALMGWDHHATLPADAPAHTARAGPHSLYELYTLPQLVSAFDLAHVTHRKAVVDLDKLRFLNKMTLRRDAGRLGADGELVALGKEAANDAEGYGRLVDKYQAGLKDVNVLRDCPLIDDRAYVEKVFDAELPRSVTLKEMAAGSIFFYLDPVYSNHEAETLLRTMRPSEYVTNLSTLIALLDALDTESLTEDAVWSALHDTVAALGLRKKALLVSPMRHALTGRRAGPGVPTIIAVLGRERALGRLRAGLEYVKNMVRQ